MGVEEEVKQLQQAIAASAKEKPADIVIKNGKIIDVFSHEVIEADVAITDGMFVGIGSYAGKQVIDAKGLYVSPGFIDGHIHIESSMVTPSEYAKVVLPHGVTTIVADPHEIGNVSGETGIEFMIAASEGIPLDVYVMMPSCVPVTTFENTGAALYAEQLRPFYEQERVRGLGEVMNFTAVAEGEPDILQKITDAARAGKNIDGHAAGIGAEGINIYMTAGIRTDHECVTEEEAVERLRRGMYVMIREGTASKDLQALIGLVNERNARRFLFVTDDKHLDELLEEGSIDHNVRMAIGKGTDPLTAIQMATLNAAECFRFHKKGAIAPGYEADFLLLDDLEKVSIAAVYKAGVIAAEKGTCLPFHAPNVEPPVSVTDSVNYQEVKKEELQIPIEEGRDANVIGIIPNSIVTKHLRENVTVQGGYFHPSIEKDQLKVAVVERHNKTGNVGTGILKGLGLKKGAIVSTIGHDSHNIIAAGTNDKDILTAIRAIGEYKGGQAVVEDGRLLAVLPLSLSGLMSEKAYTDVAGELNALHHALVNIGFTGNFNPFSTLSFLPLPVIPELKITDSGLFHVSSFQFISIQEEKA
ncbi:adenine deaminase [Bacillus piscicola]|uniref:adenine deaminase n=1 Tax=Bacillus piscicola TaxID=1632684 RepID=UPI001F08AB1B|nr:adenine deaminase [Bacillus piscicola]